VKTSTFDAAANISSTLTEQKCRIHFLTEGKKVSASLHFYSQKQRKIHTDSLVFVRLTESLPLKWKDRFKILEQRDQKTVGEGTVLNPFFGLFGKEKSKKKIDFLQGLKGSDKEMIMTLAQYKSIKGLWEQELLDFSSLSQTVLQEKCQELEAESKLKILSFSPLFVLTHESFHFLCQRILDLIERFHENHPRDWGPSIEKIKKRFGVNQKILSLAFQFLLRSGKIKESDGQLALLDFNISLSPREEKHLEEMEKMALQGELHLLSLEELREHFHLTPQRLNRLLSLLVEKRKIVRGKEGFIIHSRWLEDVISRIRSCGKKELSVADFKEMTGLTRKYAIPLLELLDQRGVTRRVRAKREIL
jgi:selenocysteine-specific elongation factor